MATHLPEGLTNCTRNGSATTSRSCREKQCLAISIDVNTARLSWKDKSLT